jgi:Tol biopolymer transport system component
MKILFYLALILVLTLPIGALAEPNPLIGGVEPMFSQDGSLLSFASMENGYRDIFTVDRFGSKKILTQDIYWDGQPSFSADEKSVVFISDRSGNRELWEVNLFSKNLRQLTDGVGWKSNPSVSLTGAIAFTSGRHPNLDIYVLKGGVTRRLTHLNDEIYSLVWSPNGEKLAFVLGEDLMLMNSDGSALEKIGSNVYSRGLSWSSQGEILYLSKGVGYDLWKIDVEKLEKKLIYEGLTDSWEVNPTISRNGEIAFSTDKDGFYQIYLMEIPIASLQTPPSPVESPILQPELVPATLPVPISSPTDAPQPSKDVVKEPTEIENENRFESTSETEIEVPEANFKEVGEIKVRDSFSKDEPTFNVFEKDEIVQPRISTNEVDNIIPDEGSQDFLLLAIMGFIVISIEKLKSRRPKYGL